MATVINSVNCVAILPNNSCLMQRYNFFDRINKMGEKFIPYPSHYKDYSFLIAGIMRAMRTV